MKTSITATSGSTATPPDSLTFEKPGPGKWELDTAHFAPTASRVAIDIIEQAVRSGLTEGADLAGAPFAGMDAKFVHGRFYRRLIPLVGSDSDMKTPPAPLLWLATRLHPTFRKRSKQAAWAMKQRVWLDELRRWDEEWKPELLAFHRAATAVDLPALSDSELAAHLASVYERLRTSSTLHFRLHVSDMGPIGRLLIEGRKWGFDDGELMSCLAGHSPSTSAPAVALEELRRVVADAEASPESLDDVRAIGPKAAQLLDAYLAEFGPRLTTGYDVSESTLAELPALVLASVRQAPSDVDVEVAAAELGTATETRLRESVPAEERTFFDELLDDARRLYGLRDENGPLTYQWPAGLLRLAMLESARRFVTSGALRQTDHVWNLSADEIVSLLAGATSPSASDIAERDVVRLRRADVEAPRWLGGVDEPPPTWVLPKTMAPQAQATFAILELLEASHVEPLTGTGVGTESYIGVARLVHDAGDAADKVEPGDIVVAPFTVPTYNSILTMAGAVIVEQGGLICHTAVIARELDIPAVVGAVDAMSKIPDGATIEVDPVAGKVRVL